MPCPERVFVLMRRSTLRTAVAAAVLAVFLLPASAMAGKPSRPVISGGHSFVAALWNLLSALLPRTGGPQGATASACDNRWGIDPDGGAACATSDNHWTIDPDG